MPDEDVDDAGLTPAQPGLTPETLTSEGHELFVVQGYYRNPGPKQSRSARFGPGLRSEEEALGLVLSWLEGRHAEAVERAKTLT